MEQREQGSLNEEGESWLMLLREPRLIMTGHCSLLKEACRTHWDLRTLGIHHDVWDQHSFCGASLSVVEGSATWLAFAFWVPISSLSHDYQKYSKIFLGVPWKRITPSSRGTGLELHNNKLGFAISLQPKLSKYSAWSSHRNAKGGLSTARITKVYATIFLHDLLGYAQLKSLCTRSKPLLFEA